MFSSTSAYPDSKSTPPSFRKKVQDQRHQRPRQTHQQKSTNSTNHQNKIYRPSLRQPLSRPTLKLCDTRTPEQKPPNNEHKKPHTPPPRTLPRSTTPRHPTPPHRRPRRNTHLASNKTPAQYPRITTILPITPPTPRAARATRARNKTRGCKCGSGVLSSRL